MLQSYCMPLPFVQGLLFHLAFTYESPQKNNFVPSFLFSKLQVVQTECSRYTHLHLGASPLSRDGGLRENMGQGLRVSGDKILRRALGKSRRSSDPRWHWPRYYFLHRYWQLTKTTESIQIQDFATITEVKSGFVKTLKNRKMYHMLHINFKLAIRATKIRSLADFQIFLIIRDDQLITCLVPAWLCFYAMILILNCLSSSVRWLAAVWEFCIFPQVATAPPLPSLLSLASHKSAQDILGLLNLRLHHEEEDEQPPNCKDGLRLTCIKSLLKRLLTETRYKLPYHRGKKGLLNSL